MTRARYKSVVIFNDDNTKIFCHFIRLYIILICLPFLDMIHEVFISSSFRRLVGWDIFFFPPRNVDFIRPDMRMDKGRQRRGRESIRGMERVYRRMYKETLISWHCVKFLALSAFSVRWSVFDRKTTPSSRRGQGVTSAFIIATRNAPLDMLERKNTSFPPSFSLSFASSSFPVRVSLFYSFIGRRPSYDYVWARYIKMIYSPY